MERSKKDKKKQMIEADEVVVDLPAEKKGKKAEKGCCGKKKKAKIPMVPFGVLLRYDEQSQWLVALGELIVEILVTCIPLTEIIW